MNLYEVAPCPSVFQVKSMINEGPANASLFGTCIGTTCSTISPSIASSVAERESVSRSSTPADDDMVILNVYSLIKVNSILNYAGLGIYHSGVQVYGVEWAYAGYHRPIGSIYRMKEPRNLSALPSINGVYLYKESIPMGKTKFTYEEIKKIVSLAFYNSLLSN